jgi:hypothetical protein
VLWDCYVFSGLVPCVILLVTLRYALGRCNNIYCVGFTDWKCGRAVWYPVVSVVWSVLPWHCLSGNVVRGSGQRAHNYYFMTHGTMKQIFNISHYGPCFFGYLHTPTHAHTNTCTHQHVHTPTRAHTNTCTHRHMHTPTHVHTNTCTHQHVHTQTHVHTNTRTHAKVHVGMIKFNVIVCMCLCV